MNGNLRFGSLGEKIAEVILRKKGYSILEKNFRSKYGEIDIIAKENDTLVFVEVKNRNSDKFGKPEEFVTRNKLDKIYRMAAFYRKTHKNLPEKMRVDVVALIISGKKIKSLKHIRID